MAMSSAGAGILVGVFKLGRETLGDAAEEWKDKFMSVGEVLFDKLFFW
jgi:hypothetical protein